MRDATGASSWTRTRARWWAQASPLLEGFFEGVRGWHRWLGASGSGVRKGRAVTGAANVAFLFLLLTGPLLWLPRRLTRKNLVENLVFGEAFEGRRGNSTGITWLGSGRSCRWL